MSGTVYMPIYMIERFSYSKVMAGILLSITLAGGAFGRIIWGRISDIYFSERRENEIILVGFIAAATCIILGILPANSSFIFTALVVAIFGFTAIGYNVLFLTHIGEIAGPERAGQAIGFFVTVTYCGAVISPPLFGFTVDLIGFSWAWIIFGGMLALAIIFAILYTQKNFGRSSMEADR